MRKKPILFCHLHPITELLLILLIFEPSGYFLKSVMPELIDSLP